MSYSVHTYVIIPKGFDFEKHLSILEQMGSTVDIGIARNVLTAAKERHAHCQDFEWGGYNIQDGFQFALQVLKDLNMILYEENDGSTSGDDWILNVSKEVIKKKELIEQLFEEI